MEIIKKKHNNNYPNIKNIYKDIIESYKKYDKEKNKLDIEYYVIKIKNKKENDCKKISNNQLNDLISSIKNMNIKLNIFDACIGNKGYKIIKFFLKIFKIEEKDFLPKLKHPKRPGRIGCLGSHLTLWLWCIYINKNLIILENDVVLIEHLNNVLKNINHDLILFDSLNPYDKNYNKNIKEINNKNIKLKVIDGHTKKRNTNGKLKGAYSYLITPNGSKKIINYIIKSDKWLPVDYYFDEDILKIGTTNKIVFRINEKYPAGVISTTKNLTNLI